MSSLTKAVNWVDEHVQDQSGKVFVITGATSGLGQEAARLIAYKNGKVILACRNEEKARKTIDNLVNGVSEATYKDTPAPIKVKRENLDFLKLDLGDLDVIEAFSNDLKEKYPKIDCLICNAGVMAPPSREETHQGFEEQMGVNVFGHFALVCRVAPLLQNAVKEDGPKPRIVWQSSFFHRVASGINFDDIDWKKSYKKWQAYSESKLGVLLLMQILADKYPQFIVDASHPGYTATNLQDDTIFKFFNPVFGQAAMMGTLPAVMAATDTTLESRSFAGPYWFTFGLPDRCSMTSYAKDMKLATEFYRLCVEKTKLTPPTF